MRLPKFPEILPEKKNTVLEISTVSFFVNKNSKKNSVNLARGYTLNLLDFLNTVGNALLQGTQVDVIYTEFRKTFDSISILNCFKR